MRYADRAIKKEYMKKKTILLLALFLATSIWAQPTFIRNVNLVDVRNGKIIPAQTIVINGKKIEQIGASSEIAPISGASTIDGSGKYLMPGMTDAHIHFFQSGGLYTRPDAVDLRKKVPYERERDFGVRNAADYLSRYLRLGITSVVDVGGPMSNFAIRDTVGKSGLFPNILATGPLFSMIESDKFGNDKPIIKVTSSYEADVLLDKMLPFKPDFIKVWYIVGPNLPAEKNFALVKHIADRTHANGLKLAVHATELKTAQLAVEAGADILVHSIDDELVPEDFVNKLVANKVTYIPTLIVSHGYYNVFSGKLPHHPQDLAWANAFAYGSITDPEAMSEEELPSVLRRARKNGIPESAKKEDSISAANLMKLHNAGVNIATGTDAGNIGTFHASSYIQELEAMQRAGLSITEVIKTSTINPAIGFGRDQQWGSIEKGKLANLLLLKKNPFESLKNLSGIELIYIDGKELAPDSIVKESPDAVVQRQVNAYNARDINAFMDAYSEDVELFSFPNKLTERGKADMRKGYEGLFSKVTNLYCEIEKRMVIGNKVIDHEKVRAGTKTIRAVAVYEVEDGKIRSVTFIK
jgi:imidazolonepropionase-like amidohydrolase